MKRATAWLLAYALTVFVTYLGLLEFSSVRLTFDLAAESDHKSTFVLGELFWAPAGGAFAADRARHLRVDVRPKAFAVRVPSRTDGIRIDPLEASGRFSLTNVEVWVWRWRLGHLPSDDRQLTVFAGVSDAQVDSRGISGRSIGDDPQVVLFGAGQIVRPFWLRVSAIAGLIPLAFAWIAFRRWAPAVVRPRRWVVRVAGAAALLVAIEGLCLAGLMLIGRWPARSFEAEYRAYRDTRSRLQQFGARTIGPHPYFGFQLKSESANNYGFQFAPDYPYVRQPNDFVIGIFGGSVAESFARDADRLGLLSGLSARIPQLQGRRVRVLNFAMPAGKQPQQFIVASYFAPQCDLVLNLDGFNDSWVHSDSLPPELPWSYPELYEASDWRRLWPVASTQAADLMAAFAADHAVVARSATFFAAWQLAVTVRERIVTAFRDRAWKATQAQFRPETGADVVRARASVWSRYAVLEDAVVRAAGRRVIFFLQPNQYVPPAKPFSHAEVRDALADADLAGRLPGQYAALQAEIPDMRRKGLLAFDLTDAFAHEKGTVYVDSCCHVNLDGNRILADRIMSTLAQEGAALFPVRIN